MSNRWACCDRQVGEACTVTQYDDFADGITRDRIAWQSDDGHTTCHDCKAPDGGLHHPGCDVERCPRCGAQAISCGCTGDDDEDDEDDDA